MYRYFFDVELSHRHPDERGEVVASDRLAIHKAADLLSELASDDDLMIEARGEISVVVRREQDHLVTLTAALNPLRHSAKPDTAS